jgi:hypothetical protein
VIEPPALRYYRTPGVLPLYVLVVLVGGVIGLLAGRLTSAFSG